MPYLFFFFFNDTATTEIYTLSLHDALPIYPDQVRDVLHDLDDAAADQVHAVGRLVLVVEHRPARDRSEEHTSNSSHSQISYAVFCLKKKKKYTQCSVQIK